MNREKKEVAKELKEKLGETSPLKKKNQQLERLKQKYKVKRELQGGTTM